MKTIAKLLCGAAFAAVAIVPASAKDLNKVGISVGLLGNPFFVATIKGIEDAAKKINPKVEVTSAPGAETSKAATMMPAACAFFTAGAIALASTALSMITSTPAAMKESTCETCLLRS